MSEYILTNIPQFGYWSGSCKNIHHHYGDYGLAQHTMEVIDLMFSSHKTLKLGYNRFDLMFLAGLFHDIGKVWDYKRFPEWGFGNPNYVLEPTWSGTEHKRNIHHISRSGLVWSKAVDSTGLFGDEHDEVLHAILAHHGRREWGSPVAPKSRLAWLLHLSDQTSARMDDCNSWDVLLEIGK